VVAEADESRHVDVVRRFLYMLSSDSVPSTAPGPTRSGLVNWTERFRMIR
jgi:hypothetical protein